MFWNLLFHQVEVFGLDVGNLEFKIFYLVLKFFLKTRLLFTCFVRGSDITDAELSARKSNHAIYHGLFQGGKTNFFEF